MDPNTYSSRRPPRRPDGLAALAAEVDELAAQDLDGLADPVLAEQVLALRRLVDRLDGQWLKTSPPWRPAAAPGPSSANRSGRPRAGSGPGSASAPAPPPGRCGRPGPCSASPPRDRPGPGRRRDLGRHAAVVAHGTSDLPDHVRAETDPVLVEAARRLDPPQLPRVTGHLRLVTDPTAPTRRPSAATSAGGCGRPRPGTSWSPSTDCWSPRLARPAGRPGAPGPPGRRQGSPQRPPPHR
jgi:hypothetical protein